MVDYTLHQNGMHNLTFREFPAKKKPSDWAEEGQIHNP